MGYINHSQMVTVGLLLGSLHYINKFPWKWITIKIFDICEYYSYIIYPLYPESSIPRCMISSDTPLYSHIVGCISMIFPYIPILLMDVDGLYPMIIFHHGMTIPGATRPVPPVLCLAKSLRPRFPGPGAIGPENLWEKHEKHRRIHWILHFSLSK